MFTTTFFFSERFPTGPAVTPYPGVSPRRDRRVRGGGGSSMWTSSESESSDHSFYYPRENAFSDP